MKTLGQLVWQMAKFSIKRMIDFMEEMLKKVIKLKLRWIWILEL